MQTLDEEMNELCNDEDLVTSEDEREKQEEEKEKFEVNVTFTTPVPQLLRAIVVCAHGNAQALSKVIFHDKLIEIGKAEAKYHEKTTEILKIYHLADH